MEQLKFKFTKKSSDYWYNNKLYNHLYCRRTAVYLEQKARSFGWVSVDEIWKAYGMIKECKKHDPRAFFAIEVTVIPTATTKNMTVIVTGYDKLSELELEKQP